MKGTPKISEAEWEVMKIIWAQAPCDAGRIIESLNAGTPQWHPRTVKTLLNRLVKKGALGYRKERRAYVYRPLVAEEKCVETASRSFLQRVFGGSLKPMLAHFVERRKLSDDEIAELKRILEEKK